MRTDWIWLLVAILSGAALGVLVSIALVDVLGG